VTTSASPKADLPQEEPRRWGWQHPVGPRWLLIGDADVSHDRPMALCAEIEGLSPPHGTAPSWSGADLGDVVVHSDPIEPLPTGILDTLAHRRTGEPTRNNQWAGYNRALRHHWAGVALTHHSGAPDQPAGATYDLDGRFVTDVEGFYCAIGEAINGPGGYFGWNLDALDDRLRGGFGAQTPFRLVWHDSAVAREQLTARTSSRAAAVSPGRARRRRLRRRQQYTSSSTRRIVPPRRRLLLVVPEELLGECLPARHGDSAVDHRRGVGQVVGVGG
jgi:hypothetical protein